MQEGSSVRMFEGANDPVNNLKMVPSA